MVGLLSAHRVPDLNDAASAANKVMEGRTYPFTLLATGAAGEMAFQGQRGGLVDMPENSEVDAPGAGA